MKLPISKDENCKRLMMTSGALTGRKDLLSEHREINSVRGHDVQCRANMDLGSGDTPDFYPSSTDIQNNYDSYNWNPRFDSHDFLLAEPIAKTHISPSEATPTSPSPPPPPPSSIPLIQAQAESSSSESVHRITPRELSTGRDHESSEARNSTYAVVEDGKEPNFTANESNPTVPAPTEPSKTSTLRLSDRTRSESEDDIEKVDETDHEGTLIGHKTLYKTTVTTGNSPNSDKMDKNGNRSDLEQNEADNDCVVQCLYYTIQCCECIIS